MLVQRRSLASGACLGLVDWAGLGFRLDWQRKAGIGGIEKSKTMQGLSRTAEKEVT